MLERELDHDTGAVDAAARHVDQLAEAAGDRLLDFGARIIGLGSRIAQAGGDVEEAARLFQQALDSFGADDPMLDRALLQHAFGSLLRAWATAALPWTSSVLPTSSSLRRAPSRSVSGWPRIWPGPACGQRTGRRAVRSH